MKQNVYLIDLGTGSDRNLLPLGVGLISSYARSRSAIDEAYDIHIHFLRDDPQTIAEGFDNPAVIGLALYVWNKNASLTLAAELRNRFPDALIVVGGYSVPKDPARIKQFLDDYPQIDLLIHGEGEFTFADLLETLAEEGSAESVPGLTCRVGSGFVTSPPRERIGNLNDIPSPFLDGTFDALMAKHRDKVTGVVWETNRGCPFACTFCDWGNADVNKIKKFDLDRLKAELDWISANQVFYIYLADANFGIFLERDMELARHIASLGSSSGYPGFMAVNWTKNSHERIIEIADCFAAGNIETSVTLAMQSFSGETLEAIKRKNIKPESLLSLKKAYHDKNLPTYTELILGLPGETYESFVSGLDQAMTTRLSDHWVCHLCTLLENTEMESDDYRSVYGLETSICAAGIARRSFDHSGDEEFEELVVSTAAMPPDDWRRAYSVSYLSSALYNFRSAFFVINYLKHLTGARTTDIVNFFVDLVDQQPEKFPVFSRGVNHVAHQHDKILDGVACLSEIGELGGNLALPHEAVLAILLDNDDGFYADLRSAAELYCEENSVHVDPDIWDEIVLYQQARMPIWEERENRTLEFKFSVPQFFEALVSGVEPSPIIKQTSSLEVLVRQTTAADKFKFAAQRTRSGHTIHLNDVRVIGDKRPSELSTKSREALLEA